MAGSGYGVGWEFRVRPEFLAEFVHAYGPDGQWERLFRRADGFVGTRLIANRAKPGYFLTLDLWRDLEAYRAFRERFSREYALLDAICAAWTTHEALVDERVVLNWPAQDSI